MSLSVNSPELKLVISTREDVLFFCKNALNTEFKAIHVHSQTEMFTILCDDLKRDLSLLVMDASIFFNKDEAVLYLKKDSTLRFKSVIISTFDTDREVVQEFKNHGFKTVSIPCEGEFTDSCMEVLARSRKALEKENNGLEYIDPVIMAFPGKSSEAVQLRSEIQKAAHLDTNVMLLGETGTGKTFLAELLHKASFRKSNKFVHLNMPDLVGSIAESQLFGTVSGAFTGAVSRQGFFKEADGGSLFMDEVTEIPLDLQSKFLKILDNSTYFRIGSPSVQKVDVRFISASNADIRELVKTKEFREDLFYRLAQDVIRVPPLRKRPKDIPLVARSLLDSSGRNLVDFDSTAIDFLENSKWPGNIRQLKNCLKRIPVGSPNKIVTADELRKWYEN